MVSCESIKKKISKINDKQNRETKRNDKVANALIKKLNQRGC